MTVQDLFEEFGVFSIRMALEANGQVFHLNLNRVENGVVYFRLEEAGVEIPRESRSGGLVDTEEGQPEEMQTLSPGAEEGAEAVPSPEARARAMAEVPGGPEGEGVEPPPPPKKKAARSKRGQR
jgi:hypothetical protein